MEETSDSPIQAPKSEDNRDDFIQWLSFDTHSINRLHPYATLLQCFAVRAVQVRSHFWPPVFSSALKMVSWALLVGADVVRLMAVQCMRRVHIVHCNLLRRDIIALREDTIVSLPAHGKYREPHRQTKPWWLLTSTQ